jgi:dTDP-glucose 4,6-dehydratase
VVDTLLVTGGAGFIGSNLVRLAMATTPWRIVVFDLLTYAGHRDSLREFDHEPRFSFVQGDVADPTAVEIAFRRYAPRYVLHLAAESHDDRSIDGPRDFVRTNVVGTHELLIGARAFFERLEPEAKAAFRFVHVSTDEVFGSLGPTGAFDETSPHAPRSPYAASKAGADHLAAAYHATYGLPVLVTNCSNNYGPYQFPEKLIPLMILNALEGRPLPVYGDGLQVRDWLHVEDHAAGLLLAAQHGRPGERYLFGGGCEKTNLDVVGAICASLEHRRPAAGNRALVEQGIRSYRDLIRHVTDRPGHDQRYAVDARRVRRDLGWAPHHAFEAGIDATVGWYLEHHAWCASVSGRRYDRQRLGVLPGPGAGAR